MQKRGQISIEYIIIMSFAFLLTLPLFVIFQQEANDVEDTVINAQIEKAGRTIIDTVNEVYYYGEPTKMTLRVFFPENIKNVTIEDQSITFLIESPHEDYQWSFSADANITGAIRTFSGVHVISIEAEDDHVTITD